MPDNLHDYVVLARVYSNCSSLGFIMDGLTLRGLPMLIILILSYLLISTRYAYSLCCRIMDASYLRIWEAML